MRVSDLPHAPIQGKVVGGIVRSICDGSLNASLLEAFNGRAEMLLPESRE